MKILQTTDLKKYYGTEPNITRALDGVNFSVEEGEFVAVVGTSGSGKSTLLHMMGGLDTPTSGSVMVRDKELAKMNDEQLTIFRRRNIGFIFQNYNLVPILNVHENIVLPVELDGDTVDQKFMADVVSMLGLEDKLKNMPNNLSGGQQQRVAIARALVSKPASIALDMDYAEDMIGVDVGSVIKLTIGDQEIPVTVSGLLINDGLKNGHGPLALDSTCMVATKELFQEAMPKINCFDYSWSIVSDPKKAEQIENSLSAIISSNPDLDLDTIGIHKDYEEMENRVVFGGFQALSWLVFLFGVVNLINTTLSNQMSRKRENSVFRAIGLTRKQLCQMTIYEGICYAFSAALATLAVGLPIAIIAARKFSEMTFHVAMPYSFPFLQMGLFVLVLFGLEVILSFWTMRRQKNQSLVEEMRAME